MFKVLPHPLPFHRSGHCSSVVGGLLIVDAVRHTLVVGSAQIDRVSGMRLAYAHCRYRFLECSANRIRGIGVLINDEERAAVTGGRTRT
jgi:hypothetical protein